MVVEYNSYRRFDDESLNLFYALSDCSEKKAKCLRFDGGTYHFTDEFSFEKVLCIANHGENGFKHTAFLLEQMNDFEIDGNGSHFVFDSVMNMFAVLGCKNITLKNFTVSMPCAPYPEGKVISVCDNSFDVEFSYHKPLIVKEDEILIPCGDRNEKAICNIEFNGESHEIEYKTGDNSAGIPLSSLKKKEISPNVIRFFDAPRIPKLGNVLALMINRRHLAGLFFDGCENIKIENVKILSCVGIGIMMQKCRDVLIKECSVTSDNGKYVSSGADATHFVSCTGKITVKNCLFEHMLDDALNVHGVYCKTVRARKGGIIVKYCNSSTSGVDLFDVGDRICQMNPENLIPKESAVIKSVKRINSRMTDLSFENPAEFSAGNIIENLSKYPELELNGCTIRNNRARGVLIATKKCTVENCKFHTAGSAVVLECDGSFWFESGAVNDVVIRGNVFDRCRYGEWEQGVIYVPKREGTISGKYYHGRLSVLENSFVSCFDVPVFADNISEFVYKKNTTNGQNIIHISNIGKADIEKDTVVAD